MFRVIAKIIYTVLLFIETIVALRFVFLLIKADTGNSIVSWIIDLSNKFVDPFAGITSEILTIAGLQFDLTAIIALVFYMIIAFVVVELIKTFSNH